MKQIARRSSLPFRAVNRCGQAGYDPGLQRHHLLPLQLLSRDCFTPMIDSLGRQRIGFDDFRSNGLLLPALEEASIKMALPLHRGPHREYNAMVIERVGQVEKSWSVNRFKSPEMAGEEALMRLALLQRALSRRLLDTRLKRFTLNRKDPFGRPVDFSDLDAMADALWGATELKCDIQPAKICSMSSALAT